MEELPLLYSGCTIGSLCPKQLAGVPRKGSACCWFHKDVYLHSNSHGAEAILKASVVNFCSIIPIQNQIRRIAGQRPAEASTSMATFQLQGRHPHAAETGERAAQKAMEQRRKQVILCRILSPCTTKPSCLSIHAHAEQTLGNQKGSRSWLMRQDSFTQ